MEFVIVLKEKEVIHKLFKVLVPRYKNMPVAATSLYRISTKYPSGGVYEGVLELKGIVESFFTHIHLVTAVFIYNARYQCKFFVL